MRSCLARPSIGPDGLLRYHYRGQDPNHSDNRGLRVAEGLPVVSNGIALCNLHHSAFDAHLIGIRPVYRIEVRDDVLQETDGPMLIHGLQGFHGQELRLPRLERHRPDRDRLDPQYQIFRQAH